jgi:hypothetical protein
MRSTRTNRYVRAFWLRGLVSLFSQEWLWLLLDVLQLVLPFIFRQQPKGQYEILDYDASLEFLDTKGKAALFRKRLRIRFLQDRVIAFQDFAWGDGIIRKYRCSPGRVVDRYQEGDRQNILISLRGTKSRGDVEDFHIEYAINDGFMREKEWWQVEIRNHTQRLRITIIFPKGRRCRTAVLIRRSRHKVTPLGEEHMSELPDGRQLLAWEAKGIRGLEIYTLQWTW